MAFVVAVEVPDHEYVLAPVAVKVKVLLTQIAVGPATDRVGES